MTTLINIISSPIGFIALTGLTLLVGALIVSVVNCLREETEKDFM